MKADEFKMPKPEWYPNDNGKGTRLFAYSCAMSGKDGSALESSDNKAGDNSGSTGLMNELNKTKL